MGLTVNNPPPPAPPPPSSPQDTATAFAATSGTATLQRQMHDLHVYGVITMVLELCLCLENLLPVLVVFLWRRPRDRTVSDKLLAALSAAYVLSALVPTPLGLASTFHGSWFGGAATCECFQVTSTWCSLSALALVTYLSVDLHLSACSAQTSPLPETEGQGHQNQQNPLSRTVSASPRSAATTNNHHDNHYNSTHRLTSPQRQRDQPSTTTATTTISAAEDGVNEESLKDPVMTSPSPSAPAPSSPCVALPSGKDVANLLLFALLTLTLVIASLPVAGYGPQVMPHNLTCDPWLIATPTSPSRRMYFVAFLCFGFLNIVTTMLAVSGALLVLRACNNKRSLSSYRWEGEPRYMEERPHSRCGPIPGGSSTPVDGADAAYEEEEEDSVSGSASRSSTTSGHFYKMAGLILANQAMWIPALVIITVQKVGYRVTDATMMYAILSTSLPGLLNPLLLALLFKDYRLGYRYVLLRLCCRCCVGSVDNSSNMKDLRSRSMDSLRQLSDGEVSLNGCTLLIDDVTSASANGPETPSTSRTCPVYTYQQKKRTKKADDQTEKNTDDCASAYVVVEVPNERTPLQGQTTARPIIASLYDEYGELGGAPKTELLSPCGSEECLLNPDLFRAQTESVV